MKGNTKIKGIMPEMRRIAGVTAAMALAVTLPVSCGGEKGAKNSYPANFDKIGDVGRINWLSGRVAPDSLARFIIYGSLGQVKGARVDTLAIATNAAYEKLKGQDLDKFSATYDALVESLPLADKMKVYAMAGTEDPQGLGYRLGLEYINTIRNDHKKVADVSRELEAFRKACATDTATYRRFVIGFKTALENDHGKDLSEEIYNTFINLH